MKPHRTLIAVLLALHLIPLGMWACTPAQTTSARAATPDWARCAAAPALGQLTTWAAKSLESDDWQSWRGALAGTLGPALTCALGTLASQIPSEGADGFGSPEARIQALAAVCAEDLRQAEEGIIPKGEACKDPRHRAAWILWQERAAGRLRLTPSGRG